jgi:hypothetical protein
MHLAPFTPTTRAIASDALNVLRAAGSTLKQEWADAPNWTRLYAKYSLRRPASYLACNPKHMRRALNRVGITSHAFAAYTGFGLREYQEKNPRVPCWAAIGIILEALEGGVIEHAPVIPLAFAA